MHADSVVNQRAVAIVETPITPRFNTKIAPRLNSHASFWFASEGIRTQPINSLTTGS
jgi:hypothetical protein